MVLAMSTDQGVGCPYQQSQVGCRVHITVLGCRYIEVQSNNSFHMKATMVQQSARSSYTCNEAAVGASISRHDLSIQQVQLC